MTHKQQGQNSKGVQSGLRPGMDVYTKKSPANFPSVGMTLPSYQRSNGKLPPAAPPTRPSLKNPGQGKQRGKKWWFKRILIALLVIGIILGGWLGGRLLSNIQKLFGGSLLDVLQTTRLKGEDTGRVTILLAGNSADNVGHNGGELTDSIMLISIDTISKTAYTMSIPRDLYVDVPDSGYQKINSAYVTGKANEFSENSYPEGGMGQLEQVIEQNFGLKINYYALVNYSAVRQAVDAVGGIDYTVKSVDKRGLFDPNIDYTDGGPLVKLSNGKHRLNGQDALNLARARGNSARAYGFPQGDFDRSRHQREILTALKAKAVSADVLTNPQRLASLADAIGDNVTTDMTVGEVRRLYDLTKGIGGGAIKSVSLNDADGVNLLDNYQAPGGVSALIPAAGIDDYDDIQNYIKRLNSRDPVVRESAKVVVLNGTDTMGLAGAVRSTLSAKDVNVVDVGDAQATQPTSTIIDLTTNATSKPGTKKFLMEQFGATATKTNPYKGLYDADFIVVLGEAELVKQTEN